MSLRDQLQAVHDTRGKLTPEIVLDEARPLNSPLHDRFEWDDTRAAEAHRINQARNLITSCKWVYKEATDKAGPEYVRAFHAIRGDDREYVYEPAHEVASDPMLAKLVLQDMERQWKALYRRFQTFDEFRRMIQNDLGDTTPDVNS
jgi:hypothetical protein